jgi:hypothetical protein
VVVACTSGKRFWDDLATRRAYKYPDDVGRNSHGGKEATGVKDGNWDTFPERAAHPAGAPLLDYWEIPPTGYSGSHYAVFPPALVVPLIQAMAPPKVCRVCGEPSRRIVEDVVKGPEHGNGHHTAVPGQLTRQTIRTTSEALTLGWSDCGHNDYRPALILDPFAGSGTTLLVATGYGHDAIGFDLDARNAELARDRVGPFLFSLVDLEGQSV